MGKTTLTWEYDGLVGEGFRVYRADSPMDPENLPLPIATVGIEDREYVDETVIGDETYYYRVASYAGGAERLSGEIEHIAENAGDPHWDKVVSLLRFDGDTVDLAGREWTVTGSPAFTTDPAKFGQSIYLPDRNTRLQTVANPLVSLESFTIETFFCIPSGHGNPNSLHTIAAQTNSGSAKGQTFWARTDDGFLRFSRGANVGVGSAVTLIGVTPVLNDVVYHAALTYDYPTGKLRIFLDGNLEAETDNAVGWIPENNFTIGSYINTSFTTYGIYGYLDEFRITKGVARYTEDFTPPTEPFSNFGPFSPRDIATELWLDAADAGTVTLTSGRVSQWADKSGNNRHATQGTASRRPTWDEGIGAVVFDGSRILTIPDFYLEEGAFFVVSEAATGVGNAQFTMGQRTSSTYAFSWGLNSSGTSALMLIQGSEGESIFSAPHTGQLSVFSADYRLSETLVTRKVDGTTLSELPSQGPLVNISASWGVGGSTNNFNSGLVGSVREIIFCQAGVSHPDTLKIEGYLAWKWGLVDKLPVDHPYKHQRPEKSPT